MDENCGNGEKHDNEGNHENEEKRPPEGDVSDFFTQLAANQPQISELIKVVTESYVIYKNSVCKAEESAYQKQLDIQNALLQDRRILSLGFIAAVLGIFALTAALTCLGKFDATTLAFFLGTSVGSLLTILGKIFSPAGGQ
jgi:hypothetical protein